MNFPSIPRRLERLKTWRATLALGAVVAAIVLTVNLVLTIVGVVISGPSGLGEYNTLILYEGQCGTSKAINTGLHLLINALGTLLLGASSYAMQCLVAPTRSQIDAAHSARKWLDVGTQSLRNLWYVESRNKWLWLGLVLSSIPLHLLYNSVLVLAIEPSNYTVILVTEEFLEPFNETGLWPEVSLFRVVNPEWHGILNGSHVQSIHRDLIAGKYERLENEACINAYGENLPTQGNAILVYGSDVTVADERTGEPYKFGHGFLWGRMREYRYEDENPYGWICGVWDGDTFCSEGISDIRKNSESWNPIAHLALNPDAESKVLYCLTEKRESSDPPCSLHLGLPLAITVILFNLVKALLLGCVALYGSREEDKILTTGDAIASFLERPDVTTEGMCLITAREVKHTRARTWAKPRGWKPTRYLGFHAAGIRSWVVCILPFVLGIGLLSIPLKAWREAYRPGGQSEEDFLPAVFRSGLGTPDPATFMDDYPDFDTTGPSALALMSMLVNTPQLVLSVLYFSYNTLVTSVLLSRELCRWPYERKGLRVSNPAAAAALPESGACAQRSTYFLSVPYRYALPLQVLSAAMHWAVSQSMYAVFLRGHAIMPGYSPLGIFVVIVVGAVMLLVLLGLGFAPLGQGGMPLTGGCSIALAAACQPGAEPEPDDVAEREVKWGVIDEADGGKVGHCGFSAAYVTTPVEGSSYAGG